MTFYQRYLNGEREQVYKEIEALGTDAFVEENKTDIEKVLTETFERLAFNLDLIYKELVVRNYGFRAEPVANIEKPLHGPLENTAILLEKLKNAVSPYGHVPLSLQYFYKIVGGVNFAWDSDTYPDIRWKLADPLQIDSLDALVATVTQDWWKGYIQEYVEDPAISFGFLELAADIYHKDNVSGGFPYALQLTKEESVDAIFLNEAHGTTFINYLRICCENCAFPGMENRKDEFRDFAEKLQPLLKAI